MRHPGIYRPVVIDGEPYVDGGSHSPTNADLLARSQLDLVVVSSPMSIGQRGLRLRADQPARRLARALLGAEAARLRRRGTPVVTFQPSGDDLDVIGYDAMDVSRRGPVARQVHRSICRRLDRADEQARLAALTSSR